VNCTRVDAGEGRGEGTRATRHRAVNHKVCTAHPTRRTRPGQIFKFVPRRRGPAARPGERPSVSWLVEPHNRDSPPLAKADPTLLAGVGESDQQLARGPAARVPPLPQNDIRSTAPGWTRERDGVRVQGTRATARCARRIPSHHYGPDKFSNLSHEAAAPPRVQANGPASAGWWNRPV
jgi:hypothetical protein